MSYSRKKGGPGHTKSLEFLGFLLYPWKLQAKQSFFFIFHYAAQAFPLSLLPSGVCLLLPPIVTACCLHLILTAKMKKKFLKL